MAAGTVAISRLSEVEVASALARRARDGDCTPEQRDRGLATLDRDLASFLVVELVPGVTSRARTLLNVHRLRASDAIQLASCCHLRDKLDRDVPMVAFDYRLAAVARALGVTVPATDETEQRHGQDDPAMGT